MTHYKTLLDTFFGICLLRKGPQDIVDSRHVQNSVLVCYVLVGVAVMSISYDLGRSFTQTLLEVGMLVCFIFAVLSIYSLINRFPQTLTALFGCGTIMMVVSVPVVVWLEKAREVESQSASLGVVLVAFLAWNIAVMAHILHEALGKRYIFSVLLTLGYIFLSFQLISFVYPVVEQGN